MENARYLQYILLLLRINKIIHLKKILQSVQGTLDIMQNLSTSEHLETLNKALQNIIANVYLSSQNRKKSPQELKI